MIKLKNLLTERKVKKTSKDFVKDWIDKYAKSYDPYNRNKAIYRGISGFHSAYGYYGEKTYRRSSLQTEYYNTLLSNLPRWKKYPARNKSIICTTSISDAGYYGVEYIIVPRDNTKIGICPKNDIWDSFRRLKDIGISSLSHFNDIMEDVNMYLRLRIKDDDYNSIVNGFKKIDKEGKAYILGSLPKYSKSLVLVQNYFDSKYNLFLDYIKYLLDPEGNGFELTTYKNYNLSGSHEVWFEPDAVVIYWDQVKDLFRD